MLRAEALAISRTRSGTAVPVATGLDLEVTAGSALLVTGPNGVGKSTLALTLAGLLAPRHGRVRASDSFAAGVGEEPIRWKSRELLTRIGTVFQDPEHQFVAGSVRKELIVGPHALGLAADVSGQRADELMQRLRLDHLAEANPFTLSGGEKRRLSVATVLATRPGLLVLDEPTFGQDFRTWQEVVALLGELIDSGLAVVAVSHDQEFVSAIADREFRMRAPRVAGPVTAGPP